MATWSDVELLTNEDTNTVRFGSVSREENGSGLYQVDTLVKISTANEVIHYYLQNKNLKILLYVCYSIYLQRTHHQGRSEEFWAH